MTTGLNFPWLKEMGRPGQPQYNNQVQQLPPQEEEFDFQWGPGKSSWKWLDKLGGGGTTKDSGFGWNKGTADTIGAGLGGIGNLARGWAAIKSLGIAKDQLEENKRQYNQNYAQQLRAFEADRTRANTRISDQNAWKTAQGRTDLGSLIV